MSTHSIQLTILAACLALGAAACAVPTPLPGQFETAVAGTVSVGSTAVAQRFDGQHATLTASAPTITPTPPPTATPTETQTPAPTATPQPSSTDTPTGTGTPTAAPSATHAPATRAAVTQPPAAPTAAPAAGPLTPGTYPQNGVCTTSNPDLPIWYTPPSPILFTVCSPSIVIEPAGELRINMTWQPGQLPGAANWGGRQVPMPAYNQALLYLQDDLGNRYVHVALDGAARDGSSGPIGSVFSGAYIFPAPQAGAQVFTLVDTQRGFTLSGLHLP